MKQVINDYFESARYHNAMRRDAIAGARLIRNTRTPQGTDKLLHEVGDTVTATGCGGYNKGYQFKLSIARINQNGFAEYYGAGMWHRQKDVK